MIKPLLFVAMPFGRKTDFTGLYDIDFDDLYSRAIKPAADRADVEVVRADEERLGGFIHLPMYERLLLAEIAVVDLTLANPNVLYELGIRHAARPHTTILIYHSGSQLPFDVAPLRAIPYALEEGHLLDEEAIRLSDTLYQRLIVAQNSQEMVDSPLFQLLPGLQGVHLPHERTESFRDRARYVDSVRTRIWEAVLIGGEVGLLALRSVEDELDPRSTPEELLVDVLLGFRDLSAWNDMVSLASKLPEKLRNHRTVIEQRALGLNRRNGPGDRRQAVNMLRKLISDSGATPETCGILGRIYKDLYLETDGPSEGVTRRGYLDEAIYWYRIGFTSDPRDYYPGINSATLLLERGMEDDLVERLELLPVVGFAVARRGGLASADYWDLATIIELAGHRNDEAMVRRAASRISVNRPLPWMLSTTIRNLKFLQGALLRANLPANAAGEATVSLEDLRSAGSV